MFCQLMQLSKVIKHNKINNVLQLVTSLGLSDGADDGWLLGDVLGMADGFILQKQSNRTS